MAPLLHHKKHLQTFIKNDIENLPSASVINQDKTPVRTIHVNSSPVVEENHHQNLFGRHSLPLSLLPFYSSLTNLTAPPHGIGMNPNPLSQLADISLALNPFLQSNGEASLTSTVELFRNLLPSFLQPRSLDLESNSPASSPSPPPAHSSPIKTNITSAASVLDTDFSNSLISLPVQSVPEDLRISSKKLDLEDFNHSTQWSEAESTYSESISDDQSLNETGSSQGNKKNEANLYPCPDCGKAYSTSSNLGRHRQTHRSKDDKKARKCPHCDKTYVSMPAYSMHIRTHNLGCKCPFCGKCFSRPWLLQGHIRTHTGEKPFKCQICEKAFADKSNLRAHTQTHSNSKPFSCQKCHKSFALKSYLYKHEESSCLRGLKQTLKEERKRSKWLSRKESKHTFNSDSTSAMQI